MPGSVRVGRPNRIRHIPLSWDVAKARSNHEPKFRPVGDSKLRGGEVTIGQICESMFHAMPSSNDWITEASNAGEYYDQALEVAEPYRQSVAEALQPIFNEGQLQSQNAIRADINRQLTRLGSPLRLTDDAGRVTKRVGARMTEVRPEHIDRNPLSRWSPITEEIFEMAPHSASVEYAQFRSGTLITAMVEEQQRMVRNLIGQSTMITNQATATALVDILQEVNPTTSAGRNLAMFRGVNANGLTQPWEQAVYNRAEKMSEALARQGVTGAKAQMRVQKEAQKHADKLRKSRARMISRTESKKAQIQGKLDSFRQVVNDGLADPKTASKQWVTGATDVCEVCSSLAGVIVLLNESFEGVGDGPYAHANCRCDIRFIHDIGKAPKAVGAGDPSFRPGTPENPIVWEFPSGFKTQPSITTTFKPPGWTPPIRPPLPSTPTPPKPTSSPVEAPPPQQVPVKPADPVTVPGSNADIVWDDAGRKWADLTTAEQEFLLDSHIDDVLRPLLDEIIEAEVRLRGGATLPDLASDAQLAKRGFDPKAIKKIRKQQEEVVAKIRTETRRQVMERIAKKGEFTDELYTLVDDTLDDYVVRQGARSRYRATRARTYELDDPLGIEGVSLPGSNRTMIGNHNVRANPDILDPDSAFDIDRVLDRMRGYDSPVSLSKPVEHQRAWGEGIAPRFGREIAEELTDEARVAILYEIEDDIRTLGGLVRGEAERLGGLPDETVVAADTWMSRGGLKMEQGWVDTVAELDERVGFWVSVVDELDATRQFQATTRYWPGRGSSGWPSRQVPVSNMDEAQALIYEATHGQMNQAVTDVLDEILDEIGANPYIRASGRRKVTESTREPIEEAIRHLSRAVNERVGDGLMTLDDALAVLDPIEDTGLISRIANRIGDGEVQRAKTAELMEDLRRAVDPDGWPYPDIDDIADAVSQWAYDFWGSPAVHDVVSRGQAFVDEDLLRIARTLKRGNTPTSQLGQLATRAGVTPSGQATGYDAQIREAIKDIMAEVRAIGGDDFAGLSGQTVDYYGEQMKCLDLTRAGNERAQAALDSINRQADDWMPTEWIERANERGSVGFYNANGRPRSHYAEMDFNLSSASGDAAINVGPRSLDDGRLFELGDRTAFHEIHHRTQKNVEIHGQLEDIFFHRRTQLPPRPDGMSDEAWAAMEARYEWTQVGSSNREIGIEDDFYSGYVGKWYGSKTQGNVGISGGNGAHEVSPMAATHLAGSGTDAARALGEDLDMIDWIIGMLLGV